MKEKKHAAFSLFLRSLSVSISRNKRQPLVSAGSNILFLFMYASSQFADLKEKLFWVSKLLLSKNAALIFNFFHEKLVVEVNCN